MTVESDWKARTFSFFREMPTMLELIECLADPIQDTQNVCAWILAQDTIDNTSGEMLDFMGELIGVKRPMLQEDEDNLCTIFKLGDTSDADNSQGLSSVNDSSYGGYLASVHGLNSITNPGALITDADYRSLIKAKGKTFKRRMTHRNLYTFILTFGARVKINDDTNFRVVLDASEYDDLNSWERWYAMTKGFKPAGIAVNFTSRMYDKDSI